ANERSALAGRSWSPWRAVIGFGVVSLLADMVYEGARSITGPLLASLGASAVLVGLITGAGEAMALLLRVIFGSWADRTGRYWTITYAGYAVTVVCVPLLAITPFVATGGLVLACFLILAERFGKAVRSPAKTALLAHAAGAVGLGRGMGVHKALDQVGAVSGPLLVAAVAAVAGALWPALAVLIIPGTAALLVLVWIRHRTGDPDPPPDDRSDPSASAAEMVRSPERRLLRGAGLPVSFWLFASAAGAATAGLVTFGVISYHLTTDHVVPVATIPLIYAAAMAAEALAALATGSLFDRIKGRTLLVLPFLVAAVPVLAFSASPLIAILGVVIWGTAMGIQDSTVKALVADLVPSTRRATAYGVFAAVQGGAAMAGGAMAGALYQQSLPILIAVVGITQIGTLILLSATLRAR
ncbi:MAG: putative major facilitator superfamily transporter, partial [Propionibacteriaceae bacterium]|nr:putative major facilitator superfamily transporter [Propionibacteriaceae bacterium]